MKTKIYFASTVAFDQGGRRARAWHALIAKPGAEMEERSGSARAEEVDIGAIRTKLLAELGGNSQAELLELKSTDLRSPSKGAGELVAQARRAAQIKLSSEGYGISLGTIMSLRYGTTPRVTHLLWLAGCSVQLRSVSGQGELVDRVYPGLIREIGEHGGDLVQVHGLLESMRDASHELGGPVVSRDIPARGPGEGPACCGRERLEMALQNIGPEETVRCDIRTDEAWQTYVVLERCSGTEAQRLRTAAWADMDRAPKASRVAHPSGS